MNNLASITPRASSSHNSARSHVPVMPAASTSCSLQVNRNNIRGRENRRRKTNSESHIKHFLPLETMAGIEQANLTTDAQNVEGTLSDLEITNASDYLTYK